MMTTQARKTLRQAGKSDLIDARAVALVAVCDGIDSLTQAFGDENAMEIRLLCDYRDQLISERTRIINRLCWHLVTLAPELEAQLVPAALKGPRVCARLTRQLAQLAACPRLRVARALLRRISEIGREERELLAELDTLLDAHAPQLLACYEDITQGAPSFARSTARPSRSRMSILTRQLTVAAVAVAVGAGAPALAHATASSTTAVKAKTPLVAAITAQTPKIHFSYSISRSSVPNSYLLTDGRSAAYSATYAVARVHADGAQLPAKLEWVLGVYLQRSGDNAILYGEHELVCHHRTTGDRALSAGLADYRFSNYYIGRADSLLGIPHPARTAEPYQPDRGKPTPAGPGTLRTPTGLTAAIAMDTPVLHEDLPRNIENAYVAPNEAAASYYSLTISRMYVDAAQRPARQDWVKGVQTQLRGDELLARGEETHGPGNNPTTGNREMKDALGILREADSEIAHADALLGIHASRPSATLPSHVTYYKG